MFYLLSSAHPASRNGLPIDGYSCLEYGGHMFWCARVSFAKPALCVFVVLIRGAREDSVPPARFPIRVPIGAVPAHSFC